MCDVAVIGLALTAASTAVGVVGQLQASQAQEAQLRSVQAANAYNAQIAQNQKIAAEQDAEAIRLAGEREQASLAAATKKRLGLLRTRLAGQGIAVDEGSAILSLEDLAGTEALDRLNARHLNLAAIRQATLRADAAGAQRALFLANAANAGAAADAVDPTAAIVGTILGGAGTFSTGFAKLPKTPSVSVVPGSLDTRPPRLF